MLEAMLTGVGRKRSNVSAIDANTLLFMDMETIQDLSPAKRGVASYNSGVLVASPTFDGTYVYSTGTNGYISITDLSSMNEIGTGDYTIEFMYRSESAMNTYKNVFNMRNGSNGIHVRFGDGGFGQRLQVGSNMSTLAGCYSLEHTQGSVQKIWKKHAIQRKAGNVSYFIDDIKQSLRNNNYRGTPVTEFSDSTSISNLTNFYLGYDPATSDTSNNLGYFDSFHISKVARY